MALNPEAGLFAGAILGCYDGGLLLYLQFRLLWELLKKEDHQYLATGVLCGIVTTPLGCLAGGLAAGMSLGMIFS